MDDRPGGFPDQMITDMTTTLAYTTREINRNFKIKISGMFDGRKINTLVGVRGLVAYVGDVDLCNRLLDRAFNSMNDKQICKLRRGIRVSFYVH